MQGIEYGDAVQQAVERPFGRVLAVLRVAALEQWYLDGGTQPIATYVEDGLAALRPIWAPLD